MLLIVHGGARDSKPGKDVLKKLTDSLSSGYNILSNGGTAVDAVVNSITVLEDSGLFNAGSGGNLQLDGVRRLDASLMDGNDLRAGSVIGIEGIKNPIKLASLIMDLPHVTMTNIGARKIAYAHGLETLPQPDRKPLTVLDELKKEKNDVVRIYREYFSTVGAVSIDHYGNLAAGSSTGGIQAMLPGRVGDTAVIGAGIYAENSAGAVSCTGKGEYIIRLSMAKEICMNLQGMLPLAAALVSLKRILKIGGNSGLIVINKKGQFTIVHTTKYLPAGYVDKKGIVVKEEFKRIML
jgi:beta-aspartyl-peptidase (threonine type)